MSRPTLFECKLWVAAEELKEVFDRYGANIISLDLYLLNHTRGCEICSKGQIWDSKRNELIACPRCNYPKDGGAV